MLPSAVTWALDLDGVVWLAGRAIPGSAEAVAELRAAGERPLFLTNNSGPTVASHLASLAEVGIDCDERDLATSAQAAASLVRSGARVAVVGDEGIREALRVRGVQLVRTDESPEAIVVGRSVELDYWALAAAAAAIRSGARFVAANADATFPVGPQVTPDGTPEGPGPVPAPDRLPPDGLLPGAGAVVAYIATASGRSAEVAGKPYEAMAALVRQRVGTVDVVAGDQPDTDGLFARRVGARFGLVLSGVTRRSDLPIDPAPDFVGDDLLSLVRNYLRTGRGRTGPRCHVRGFGQDVTFV